MEKAQAIEKARSLGLDGEWRESDGTLEMAFPDGDAFFDAYHRLAKSGEVKASEDGTALGYDESEFRFSGDGFSLTLKADFKGDGYYAEMRFD